MVTLGLIVSGRNEIGFEGTGVVTRVGASVKTFKTGDRVGLLNPGCFTTKMVVPVSVVTKLGDDVRLDEAVTTPVVYATIMLGLIKIGQLKKGHVSATFPREKRIHQSK